MSKQQKILIQLLQGNADANIQFEDLLFLLERLGFESRIKGSHYILTKPGVDEILNLQPKGGQAKPYQVKQVRNVILKYRLAGEKP